MKAHIDDLRQPHPDVETEERPSKRRKVDDHQLSKDKLGEDFWNDAIPLVQFEFVIEDGLHQQQADSRLQKVNSEHDRSDDRGHWDAEFRVLTVTAEDVRDDGRQDISCLLHMPDAGPEVLRFNVKTDSDAIPALRSYSDLQFLSKKNSCHRALAYIRFEPGQRDSYMLRLQCWWRNARSILEGQSTKGNTALKKLIPIDDSLAVEPWSPNDFYDNVHVPAVEATSTSSLRVEGLECQLYPFQKRAIRWLLNRESIDLTEEGNLKAFDGTLHPSLGFSRVRDLDGRLIYVNHWLDIATTNRDLLHQPGEKLYGGILAEEMGLGKTVEVISMIILHQRKLGDDEASSHGSLRKSKSTLIVAPDSILQQWEAEIHMHAPALKVMVYEGVKSSTKSSSEEEVVQQLLAQDVILVTYRVLSKEIHYSEATPQRQLRHAKQYARKVSPLVKLHWWRVVLDECQMVESGVSQAARVVNQIPRRNAWAVSGTPVKKDVNDLLGLLTFLRLEPFCWSSKLWNRLVQDHREVFKQLFSKLALRHTKERVKNDIRLPPQKRTITTVPFTQIEEQYYSTLFQEMCDDCGLRSDGAPSSGDWDPDHPTTVEKMRTWLTRLRQVCLHPEVGGRNRRALGGDGPLRTIGEVLQVMIDQNDTSLRAEERALYISRLKRGQLFEHDKRPQEALEIWRDVQLAAQKAVNEYRKEYQRELDAVTAKEGEENATADSRLGALRMRLRSALEVEHMCTFFIANAHYQIKTNTDLTEPDSERFKELEKMETESYDHAKLIRAEMLTESQGKAENFMGTIKRKTDGKEFVTIPGFKDLNATGGIESRDVIRRAHRLFDALDFQKKTLDRWRAELVQLLTMPLVDQEEEELQGDEYETSTKQQEKVYVYVETVRAMVADRRDALTGLENVLIKGELDASLKQAREGVGHAPELRLPMLQLRLQLKPRKELRSLRGTLAELRSLKTNLKSQEERGLQRAAAELAIVNTAISRLQQDTQKHGKAIVELENEAGLYRDAMNARLEYYRQLQAVSDTVAPLEEEPTAWKLALMDRTDAASEKKIGALRSRARYLQHLRKDSSSASADMVRSCLICREDNFEVGTLLSCGHQFCSDCFSLWFKSHANCPACKQRLKTSDLHQITYKPSELATRNGEGSPSGSPSSSRPASKPEASSKADPIYSSISNATLAQIKNIDVSSSFGTKIDSLARHVLWLRTQEPGCKSVIFSQFRDFLDVLAHAFEKLGIRGASIERKGGIEKFKHDPAVECFFMHAKAHASGLNLVHATHVFLCEPLVNTALELQAIARVHRIGQHHPTTVWMVLVQGTVEQAIYDMSVERRLAHLPQDPKNQSEGGKKGSKGKKETSIEDDIEKANSLQLQEAPLARLVAGGRTGGEVVRKEDLWGCLFNAAGKTTATPAPAVGAGSGGAAERATTAFLAGEAAEQRELARR